MRIILSTLLLLLVGVSTALADYTTGDEVIRAMFKKYSKTWYSTLTFQQATTNYKADGTSSVSTWYEALIAPGKLRIDFTPLEKHDGAIFANGKVYSFRDGKLAASRDFVHPLLVLGFDVYKQPVDTTIEQLKGMNIDLSVVHEEQWQGKTAIVVGAKQGDLTTPQFWIDKKSLLFVRLFQLGGKDKKSVQETQVPHRSPAMAARLTDHIWTIREWWLCPVVGGQGSSQDTTSRLTKQSLIFAGLASK